MLKWQLLREDTYLVDLDVWLITIICYPNRIESNLIIFLSVLVNSRITIYPYLLLFRLFFYNLVPRLWQWNVFLSLHLAFVIDASQLLNACWIHIEVADYDFAHVLAALTDASE